MTSLLYNVEKIQALEILVVNATLLHWKCVFQTINNENKSRIKRNKDLIPGLQQTLLNNVFL